MPPVRQESLLEDEAMLLPSDWGLPEGRSHLSLPPQFPEQTLTLGEGLPRGAELGGDLPTSSLAAGPLPTSRSCPQLN